MRTFEEFFAPLLIMACNKTRLLRIENGLCPSCGGVVDDDEFLTCSLCREKSRIYRLKRIEQGVCIDCGKKVEAAGSRRCNSCMDSERQRKRSDYIKAKREGICIRCFRAKAVPGLAQCADCLEKEATRKAEYSDEKKNHINEVRRATQSRKRQQARKDGICTQCFKRKAVKGGAMCEICRAKERRSKENEKVTTTSKMNITEAKERGICTLYRKRKAEKGYLCGECYEIVMANLQKAYAKRNNKKHVWIRDNDVAFKTTRGNK